MDNVLAIAIVLELILMGFVVLRRVKGAKMFGPLAMIHTKHFVKFIDAVAKISPRFWKLVSTI
ncbi:MAG: hypothetical protein ABIG20_00005, partial [archaeon]